MTELPILFATAVSIGFMHTLLGPDHYVPFAALAKARQWSLQKMLVITVLCGLGHVGSSILLGGLGLALGVLVVRLETIEAARGDLAGWLMIAFGAVYLTWGLVQAVRRVPSAHVHRLPDGTMLVHRHADDADEVHPGPAADEEHEAQAHQASATPWVLFLIFVFGPCEPLIPLLMYPAATLDSQAVLLVTLGFAAATLITMVCCVSVVFLAAGLLPKTGVERFAHALAGAAVLACGVLIQVGL
ncbi:MAG: hypothetical protein DWQ37_22640 [Planctomycetota bacterium]|nr:MAG: hypothetical protein DWQ37_22640 [Planctomycetota bacterium]